MDPKWKINYFDSCFLSKSLLGSLTFRSVSKKNYQIKYPTFFLCLWPLLVFLSVSNGVSLCKTGYRLLLMTTQFRNFPRTSHTITHITRRGLMQGLLNRWTSQLDLGCTTWGLERVVSVHNST